ncbi:MAG: hypothetical protein IJJ15_05030 [Ruminococcus sp.]|nr:hypothetical protein [Ruminococcus sp.]
MKPEERRYSYSQSSQIKSQTGLIGYLRADLGKHGKEFYSTWFGFRDDLNTPAFKKEIDMVINSLREKGNFLSDRTRLTHYCHSDPAMYFQNDRSEYGVRINTREYAYLLRLIPLPGNYNLYCYCYKKDWLDMHLAKAERGIRFADQDYNERFRLADGDYIRIISEGAKPRDLECRYIDDYHFEVGDNIYHTYEFAEKMQHSEIIPLRASLPERCYVYIQSENKIGVVKKGENGYEELPLAFSDSNEAKKTVDDLNKKDGVTKAQAEAMLCGSMFGWQTPAADPKNYDKNGVPQKMQSRDTER